MKLLKKMRYIFSILLVVCLFFNATPVGEGFIVASFGLHLDGLELLILKVHEPQWKIGYRYGAECTPEDRQNGEALTEAISASLRTWLKPLKELNPERPITDSFVYELQADFNPNLPEDLEGLRAVDLRVTFRCTQGISSAPIGRIYPPQVVMQHGAEIVPSLLSILTHELGHTFGLADTYARPGIMRSRGGLPETAGTQPASMMAGGFRGDTPAISEDDKRGIVWLYKYFYEDLATDDCFFADYVFEEEPRGCVPKYPLIFETKYSPPLYALHLLKEDPTIDINAQDDTGMTALHYAVLNGYSHIVSALLARDGIDSDIKDKNGKTPLQVARELGFDALVQLLSPEPEKEPEKEPEQEEVLDIRSVSAKNNLTTMWGAVKKNR